MWFLIIKLCEFLLVCSRKYIFLIWNCEIMRKKFFFQISTKATLIIMQFFSFFTNIVWCESLFKVIKSCELLLVYSRKYIFLIWNCKIMRKKNFFRISTKAALIIMQFFSSFTFNIVWCESLFKVINYANFLWILALDKLINTRNYFSVYI